MGLQIRVLMSVLCAGSGVRVVRRQHTTALEGATDQIPDCAGTCARYVRGGSADLEYVCFNSGRGWCSGEATCPAFAPRCRQLAGGPAPTPTAAPTCSPVCSDWSPAAVPAATTENGVAWREVTYGKYHAGDCDYSANTFTIFTKAGGAAPRPTIVEIHGGGFVGGSNSKNLTSSIKSYTDRGFTYVSMTYRMVAKKYFYTACNGENTEEEFIEVSPDGGLSIPDSSKAMSTYTVKVGRTEFFTKCIYDAARAMDYIVEHADELQVDLSKINLIANSAGGAGMNYLAWTYPRLSGMYTSIAVAVNNEQLDYPVDNGLSATWSHYVAELGREALFSEHFTTQQCNRAVGNSFCTPAGQRVIDGLEQDALCNQEHHDLAMSFCGDAHSTTTFGELASSLVFPTGTDHERGLSLLHLPSEQIRLAQRTDFYFYVINTKVDTAHHAIYAKRYLDICKEVGMKCAAYYSTWANMKETSKGTMEYNSGEIQYAETFNWHAKLTQAGVQPTSSSETLEFLAFASGL